MKPLIRKSLYVIQNPEFILPKNDIPNSVPQKQEFVTTDSIGLNWVTNSGILFDLFFPKVSTFLP